MTPLHTALDTFIKEQAGTNATLRRHGATHAAERGDEVLVALRALLDAQEDPAYTPEEAATLTGVHVDSVRRGIRQRRYGAQGGKHGAMRVRASELHLLRPRKKRTAPPDTAPGRAPVVGPPAPARVPAVGALSQRLLAQLNGTPAR